MRGWDYSIGAAQVVARDGRSTCPRRQWPKLGARVVCAIEMYAAYHGDWKDWAQSYTYHKLSAAAEQMEIEVPVDLIRARADATLTLRVMQAMAAGKDCRQ